LNEIKILLKLRPVERYALKFLEAYGEISLEATQEQTEVYFVDKIMFLIVN
jgi:hypothetical protein